MKKSFTFEGKRYWIRGDNEVDIAVKIAMKKRDLEENKITISGGTLVKDWAIKCFDIYKTGVKDITMAKYKSRLNCCILQYIGSMQLKSVKPLHCQTVLNYQQGNSKYQIKQTRQFLYFIFEKAKENNLILTNPAANLVEPSGTKSTRRSMNEKERKAFLNVCKDFPIFMATYYCGCRPSEAMELKGFDLQKKGGYPTLHIRGTKTEASDRYVPIPTPFYNVIKNTPKFDYLFTNQAGHPFNRDCYERAWKSLIRAMNIDLGCRVYRNQLIEPLPVGKDLVPYCLRHTYCTNLQKQGIDIRTAQYLMGHADIKMTANIYTHADEETIISAAELLCTVNE